MVGGGGPRSQAWPCSRAASACLGPSQGFGVLTPTPWACWWAMDTPARAGAVIDRCCCRGRAAGQRRALCQSGLCWLRPRHLLPQGPARLAPLRSQVADDQIWGGGGAGVSHQGGAHLDDEPRGHGGQVLLQSQFEIFINLIWNQHRQNTELRCFLGGVEGSMG